MDYKIKLKNIDPKGAMLKADDNSNAFHLSKIIQNSEQSRFLHIVSCDLELKKVSEQISFFLKDEINNKDLDILAFPAWDCLPYDRVSPKSSLSSTRINTLYKLSKKQTTKKLLVIATINSFLQKTIPLESIANLGLKIEVGDEISIDDLTKSLIDNSFSRRTIADSVGEFAVRGSIVDIISYNNQIADDLIGYRLDFFGNTVESIKVFDPTTQITNNKVRKIDFLPSVEINLNQQSINNFRGKYRNLFGAPNEDALYNAICEGRHYAGAEHFLPLFYEAPLGNLTSYLQNFQISLNSNIGDLKEERLNTIAQYYQNRVETIRESKKSGAIYNPIKPELLYLNSQEFDEILNKNPLIEFTNKDQESSKQKLDLETKSVPNFALASRSSKANVFDLLNDFLKAELKDQKILLACFSLGSQDRTRKILLDHKISSKIIEDFADLKKLPKNYLGLCLFDAGTGFYSSDLMVIGEGALFGEKIARTSSKKSNERILGESINLEAGELVVHRYHGIGKFDGLQTIETLGIKNEFLKIIYDDNNALFVPVEDIGLITRYGSDSDLIQLDRLGGSAWTKRREKARQKIKIAAKQLIDLAAARHIQKAPALVPDLMEYEEFKARFGFDETQDQLKAIEEIEEDLEKGSPMDRLVCGDVGFGKTEVAMRAAFIVASAKNTTHKNQVAIITPTTLLCRQHYHNFLERFKDTNLKIAQLSRMVTASNAKTIKQDLADGKIDIIIGTHALLSKNIQFKNLTLLIVDEEQHFGVAQKERIKELKNNVHILTLSATPIPRTMQMSLSSVKELSIIATPPADRLAVRNYVMPYDPVIVREAIMREYQRGGKVFFVVPRIQDIAQIHDSLLRQIPEVKVEIGHGQMAPNTLDKIMNDFYDDKFDVLLSTTIIESGIDIASANTIIIYKAEMFGLAQLYQLRGRVGRGKIRGYAYLTTKSNKLSKIAKKKMEVLQTLDELGAGFSIASHDMDIRGTGNLLGDEQSGHVRETGVELYQEMLNQTIKALKSGVNIDEMIAQEEKEQNHQIQIKLGISILIPEIYIENLATRMQFYKRIGNIKNKEEGDQIAMELIDRFGKLPDEINNLLQISNIKSICKKAGIETVISTKDGILVGFKDNKFENPDKLLEMVFSSKNKIKLEPKNHKILFTAPKTTNSQTRINQAFESVNKILGLL